MPLLVMLNQSHAGEDAAIATLFQYVRPQVVAYRHWARTVTDARDLEQALLIALWEALQTCPPKAVQDGKTREHSMRE